MFARLKANLFMIIPEEDIFYRVAFYAWFKYDKLLDDMDSTEHN